MDTNDIFTVPVAPQAIEVAPKRRPGRPPLPADEKARRREEQKARYAKRADARRRALLVLQRRHADEFDALFRSELGN